MVYPRDRSRRRPAVLGRVANERGSVLALVTLLLVVFLGLVALAVDLGLLYVARGEAQRTADAAAHAGAGYLMSAPQDEPGARERASATGGSNTVRGVSSDVHEEEDVQVWLEDGKVGVTVRRTAARLGGPVRTLFAGILGFGDVDVAAYAAAQVQRTTDAKCPLPIAIPDRWCEEGDPETGNCTRLATPEDTWDPEGDGDFYIPWVEDATLPQGQWRFNPDDTGLLNTGYRDGLPTDTPWGDRGTEITLRPGPTSQGAGSPDDRWNASWWNAFRISETDSNASGGTQRFRERVFGCRDEDSLVSPGQDVQAEPGNFANPARDAFQQLIDQAPTHVWNRDAGDGGCVTDGLSSSRCITNSPRARPMVLFDPRTGPNNGAQYFPLANLVGVFVDSVSGSGPNVQVYATFVRHHGVPDSGGNPSGSMFQVLRIVE